MKVYLVEVSHMKHVFWHGILHVLMLDPKRVVLDENEKTTQKVVCHHNKLQCSVLLAINLFPHVSWSLSFLVGLFDELTKLFFCFGTEANIGAIRHRTFDIPHPYEIRDSTSNIRDPRSEKARRAENFFEYRAEVEQNKSVGAKFFSRISYFYEHCKQVE